MPPPPLDGRLVCVDIANRGTFVELGWVTILLYLAWWILCLEGVPGCLLFKGDIGR